MKIIIVIGDNPYFESSASANRWRTLIEGLSNLGVDIHLLITGGYRSHEEFSSLGRKGKFAHTTYQYLSVLRNDNIWLRRLNKFILNPLFKPYMHWRVLRIALNNPVAIIWTSSDYDSFQLVLKIKKRNPNQLTFLEMSEFLDIQHNNKGRAIHRLEADRRQHLFEAKSFYAYDCIALMTRTLLKHYENFPDPRPKLIHLPMTVDLDRFDNTLPLVEGFEQPYLAFVGVMNDGKDGVNVLIQAFSRIVHDFPTHKLYLVGPWNYDTPSHLQMIKDLNLEKRVIWMGEYNRETIPAILKNAELLLLPRPGSKQAQGGFPTKLGEYLATGNPVCATRVGEIPDYLSDDESVFFAEPGSVESFAGAMKRALTNQIHAKAVGLRGRKVAEASFSKELQATILHKSLNELLDR